MSAGVTPSFNQSWNSRRDQFESVLAHGFVSVINAAIVKGRFLAMTFPIPKSCKGFSVEYGKFICKPV